MKETRGLRRPAPKTCAPPPKATCFRDGEEASCVNVTFGPWQPRTRILNRVPGMAGQLLLNLRDASRHEDRAAFRWNMQRMGRELGSALAQSWPMAKPRARRLLAPPPNGVPAFQPVMACILRAAMPLHQGVLDVWDRADSAFVSAYRKHHDTGFDIEIEYLGAPAMEGRALVLIDPMLATGASLQAAYDALCETGMPDSVHVLAAIASEEGLANAQRWLPEGTSFIPWRVDPDLNEHGYIVPGLGDAGDLAFGPKTRS